MNLYLGKTALYAHEIDGRIVYVGIGGQTRPFSGDSRNAAWTETMKKARHYSVRILAWFDDRRIAIQHETRLITLLKPHLNLGGNNNPAPGAPHSESLPPSSSKAAPVPGNRGGPPMVVTIETPFLTFLRVNDPKYKRVADLAFAGLYPDKTPRARRDLFYRIVKGQSPVIDEAQAIVAALRYLTGRSSLRVEDLWPIGGTRVDEP